MKIISTIFICVLVAHNYFAEAQPLLSLLGGGTSGGGLLGGVPVVGGLLGGGTSGGGLLGGLLGGSTSSGGSVAVSGGSSLGGGLLGGLPVVGGLLGGGSGGIIGGLPVVGGLLGGGSISGSGGSSLTGGLLGGLPIVGNLLGGSGGILGGLGGGLLDGVVQTVGNTLGTAVNAVGAVVGTAANILATALQLVGVIPSAALEILTGTLGSAINFNSDSPVSVASSAGTVLGNSFGGQAPAGIQTTVVAQGSEIDSLLALLYNAVQLKDQLAEQLKTAVGAQKDALTAKYNQQVAIVTDLENRLTQKSSGLKLLIDSANNVASQLPKVTMLESQVADLKAQLAAASGAQKDSITVTLNAQETALDAKYSDLLNQLKAFIESGLDNTINAVQTSAPHIPADVMSVLGSKLNSITSALNSAFGQQIPNLGGVIPDLDGLKATLVALAQNIPAQLSQVGNLVNTISALCQKFPTATPEEQAAISAALQQAMAALNDNLNMLSGSSSSLKGLVDLAKLIVARLADVNALKQQLATASGDQKTQIAALLNQRQNELGAIISKMLQLTQTVANDKSGSISMNTINVLNNGILPLVSMAKSGFDAVLNTAGLATGIAANLVSAAGNLAGNAAALGANAVGSVINGFGNLASLATGLPSGATYISGSASPSMSYTTNVGATPTVTYTSNMVPSSGTVQYTSNMVPSSGIQYTSNMIPSSGIQYTSNMVPSSGVTYTSNMVPSSGMTYTSNMIPSSGMTYTSNVVPSSSMTYSTVVKPVSVGMM